MQINFERTDGRLLFLYFCFGFFADFFLFAKSLDDNFVSNEKRDKETRQKENGHAHQNRDGPRKKRHHVSSKPHASPEKHHANATYECIDNRPAGESKTDAVLELIKKSSNTIHEVILP